MITQCSMFYCSETAHAAINVMPKGGTTGLGEDFKHPCAPHMGKFEQC